MTKVKVAEVLFSLDVEKFGGGAERFAIALSQQIDRSIFKTYVLGLWEVGTQSEQIHAQELASRGIETLAFARWDARNPYRSFWKSVYRLGAFVLNQKIDILHSHSQFADIAVFLLKVLKKCKIIVRTVHDGYPLEWRKRPLRRFLLTNLLYPLVFDAEIGVANHITERLNKRWGARVFRRRAVCIHNAIELSRFQPTIRCRDCLELPDVFTVGSVGRLVEGKGYEVLLEAAKQVLTKIPNVKFILIGEGEVSNSLKQKSINLGIEDQVVFTGARTDVEKLLSQMDLFVLPSFWEGLSTVILESMASGVPVIATDIPGNREIIQDSINGLLVPPGNASRLAEIILFALQDSALRASISRSALETVKKFSIQFIAQRHQDLYYELTRRKHSRLENWPDLPFSSA